MNYTDNLNYLAQNAGDGQYVNDGGFLTQVPFWIMAGEDRILRDLDLLNTYVEDNTGTLSANRRLFTLPTSVGQFVVLATVRIVLAGPPQTTQALAPVSREWMDWTFPGDGAVGNPSIPLYWCPLNQTSILVGPPSDVSRNLKCWGTQRPASLNAQATLGSMSTGTFISNNFPDLFQAAQMIDVMAWQRNFSSSSDENPLAADWIAEYERLKTPALVEEARKRLAANGWSSRLPDPIASPPQS